MAGEQAESSSNVMGLREGGQEIKAVFKVPREPLQRLSKRDRKKEKKDFKPEKRKYCQSGA